MACHVIAHSIERIGGGERIESGATMEIGGFFKMSDYMDQERQYLMDRTERVSDTKVVGHTPGPWTVWGGSRDVYAHNEHICRIQDLPQRDGENCIARTQEYRANARLIAAAPRMYARMVLLANSGDQEAKSILEDIHGIPEEFRKGMEG